MVDRHQSVAGDPPAVSVNAGINFGRKQKLNMMEATTVMPGKAYDICHGQRRGDMARVEPTAARSGY